jgi:hypothetical protein
MTLWRRFVNWLLRPDPIGVRVTYEPLEIVVTVEHVWPTVSAAVEAPATEPAVVEPEETVWEDEPPAPALPQVRPLTVHPVPEALLETVREAVVPVVARVRRTKGPVKPAAVRAFGAKGM